MTPFGIRKRLKGALGLSGSGSTDIVQHRLTFVLPDGREQEVEAEEQYTLAMASQFLPAPINTPCPDGQCGQCVVEILEDRGLQPAGDGEREVIEKWHKEFDPRKRLACHCRIEGSGARVKVFHLFDFDAVKGD